MPAGPEQSGVAGFDRRLRIGRLAHAIRELDPPGLKDFLDGPSRPCGVAVALQAALDRIAVESSRASRHHRKKSTQHRVACAGFRRRLGRPSSTFAASNR
jgi:hypothetical protein